MAETIESAGDAERGLDVALDAERECRKKLYGECAGDADNGVDGNGGEIWPVDMDKPPLGRLIKSGRGGRGYGGDCIVAVLGVCGRERGAVDRDNG